MINIPVILTIRYRILQELPGTWPALLAQDAYGSQKVLITVIQFNSCPDFSYQTSFQSFCWKMKGRCAVSGEPKFIDLVDDYYGSPPAVFLVQEYLEDAPAARVDTIINEACSVFSKYLKNAAAEVSDTEPFPVDLLSSVSKAVEDTIPAADASLSDEISPTFDSLSENDISAVDDKIIDNMQSLPPPTKNDVPESAGQDGPSQLMSASPYRQGPRIFPDPNGLSEQDREEINNFILKSSEQLQRDTILRQLATLESLPEAEKLPYIRKLYSNLNVESETDGSADLTADDQVDITSDAALGNTFVGYIFWFIILAFIVLYILF